MRALLKGLLAAVGCAAALATAAAPRDALADVTWFVTGTFDDGGKLSGWFTINVYGYLAGYDLLAAPGSAVTAPLEYTPANSYKNNSTSAPFYITAWDKDPAYKGGLSLTFANPMITPTAVNPMVVGAGGPSWECRDSWTCPAGGVPVTRYLVDGRASTDQSLAPEPAAWSLMLLGFGALGVALRASRRREVCA